MCHNGKRTQTTNKLKFGANFYKRLLNESQQSFAKWTMLICIQIHTSLKYKHIYITPPPKKKKQTGYDENRIIKTAWFEDWTARFEDCTCIDFTLLHCCITFASKLMIWHVSLCMCSRKEERASSGWQISVFSKHFHALQYSTSSFSTEFLLGQDNQSAVNTPRAAPFTSPQS